MRFWALSFLNNSRFPAVAADALYTAQIEHLKAAAPKRVAAFFAAVPSPDLAAWMARQSAAAKKFDDSRILVYDYPRLSSDRAYWSARQVEADKQKFYAEESDKQRWRARRAEWLSKKAVRTPDIKRNSSVIVTQQGRRFTLKLRGFSAGSQTGKTFENGWNDDLSLKYNDDDLIDGYSHAWVDKLEKLDSRRVRGNKNPVTQFTAASRRNLMTKFMSLDASMWSNALFTTLTYHNKWPSGKNAKKHVRALYKRLCRFVEKYHGKKYKPSMFWRLEIKPRLSGEREGEIAPHFHLFWFDTPYVKKHIIKKWWRQITGDNSISQIDVKRLDSDRKAFNYVSKYAAKESDADAVYKGQVDYDDQVYNPETGRFSDKLPRSGANLELTLYLADIGRYWGFEGGANLIWAQKNQVVVPYLSDSMDKFFQVLENWMPYLRERKQYGFNYFDFEGDLGWMFDLLQEIIWSDFGGGDCVDFSWHPPLKYE